jgi:hypothetical protein
MPDSLDPPLPTSATYQRLFTRQEADEAFRELTGLVRSAFTPEPPLTAADIQDRLPGFACLLEELVAERELSESEAVDLMRGVIASLLVSRVTESCDFVLGMRNGSEPGSNWRRPLLSRDRTRSRR